MKRALVLGGGGSRGPYQIGVWKALRELGVEFDIVTGSSVGAINAALIVQQDYAAAENTWLNIRVRDVLTEGESLAQGSASSRELRALMWQTLANGGSDAAPLESILRANIDEDRVRSSPIELGISTTSLPVLRPIQLLKDEIPQGELVDYLLASAACFPFFKSRSIGGRQYIDGAFTDNVPASLAIRCGVQELIVVDLNAAGIVHTLHADIKRTYIRCHWDLGEFLMFDPVMATRNIKLGYQDGLKAYRKLEGNAYAFRPGESAGNFRSMSRALQLIMKRTGVNMLRSYKNIPQLYETLRANDSRFAGRTSPTFTAGRALTSAAEICGELLGLAPDKIYSFEGFNRALLRAFRSTAAITAPDQAPLEPGAHDFSRWRYLRRALPLLYKRLRDCCYAGRRVDDSFWGLAASAPGAFIAANYLLALSLSA